MNEIMKKKIRGIVKFQIQNNGILDGIYTNNALNGRVLNETVIKSRVSPGLIGTYDCTYQDHDVITYHGELKIDLQNGSTTNFKLSWDIIDHINNNNHFYFSGDGFLFSASELIVSYKN